MIEIWGGLECTVNRVGDRYFDQLDLTGHARRPDDIDRIAELGLRTLRYPLLWEQLASGRDTADWSGTDRRLHQLRAAGIRPIAGLVHHGSGPPGTNLLDPSWPHALAVHAGTVAARHPWIDAWTPVNEPLTTARFSGLYGHWYPHRTDDTSFVRALLHQVRGVVLSMRAIRKANPGAILVQTEDLAYVHATPALQYQADFENQRRWLTFDLLCGKVDHAHPLHPYLRANCRKAEELEWHVHNPCPPEIIGANYYVLSERFLDETGPSPGPGNGRDRYSDRDAVRSCGMLGLAPLLAQLHERYHLPIAITEAHLAGTREQQLRWLVHVWDAAHHAAARGVDMRAVTAWSLFGAYDWNSLCTRPDGHYEPGAFDVRGPTPRPTALAAAIRDLAGGCRPSHPVLDAPGWWQRGVQ